MARTRTTKKLAQRIDLNYFKRPTRLKRARFWLSVLAPLLALIWIAERTILKDARVYSSGRLSEPHAVLETQCAACHVQQAGASSAKASDAACLSCHDGPMHHAVSAASREKLACAECHTEHRGRIDIAAASNQACAKCHADLNVEHGPTRFAAHIRSFEDGHPEFAAVREVGGVAASDPGTIKLNHAIHMKQIRRGPNGPLVQLECGDCHRPAAAHVNWKFADAKYSEASTQYSDSDELIEAKVETVAARPKTGRELMAPAKFGTACASCHLLTFDKRFDDGVPHDKPEVVHAFLLKRFTAYIAAHPAELREVRNPDRDIAEKPAAPMVRSYTPKEWIATRTGEAEELLWRKTCKQCHALVPGAGIDGLPGVANAKTTVQWMLHAKFDHDAHRGFSCVSCHEKALTSTQSRDVLVPGIATCRTCHAPGPEHAESRCFECHTYHDWSKRKEITPTFTLPALEHGGQ